MLLPVAQNVAFNDDDSELEGIWKVVALAQFKALWGIYDE
jgi:hypothetical protein